jgi:hypothetical protein
MNDFLSWVATATAVALLIGTGLWIYFWFRPEEPDKILSDGEYDNWSDFQ